MRRISTVIAIFLAILLQLSVTVGVSGQVLPPEFSVPSGYVDDGFSMQITHPGQAVIRYTLDGSIPSEHSPEFNNPILFDDRLDNRLRTIRTTPIEADNRGFGWKWPDTTVPNALIVRARAFADGQEPSEVVSATYLLERHRHSFPVISLMSNPENFFSDSIGIYVPGDVYNREGWNHNDHWGRPTANYHQRGREWERPAGLVLIDDDGSVLQQNIGVRIHGGGSRVQPQKSFRLYSRSDYGESRFRYDMFDDGETNYNRLILRNSGQDFFQKPTMFMDAMMQSLVHDRPFDTQKFRPFVVYVNGEYWGIKNLRERFDKHYINRMYDIEEEDLDLLTNTPNVHVAEIKEGDNAFFNAVLDSLQQNHIEQLGGMEFIERHVDVDNFAQIHATHIYIANIDWPGNNNDYWRYTGPRQGKGSPKDGRFRFMLYDLDFGFSHLHNTGYTANLFDHLLTPEQTQWSNHPRSTLMFRKFLGNDEFRHLYISRQLDLLNFHFRSERVTQRISEFRDLYRDEIRHHMNRWGYPSTQTEWERNISERVEFAERRPAIVRQHLSGRLSAGQAIELTIHNNNYDKGIVSVNSMKIEEGTPGVGENAYPWSGIYMSGVPVTFRAHPNPGYEFTGWEVDGNIKKEQQLTMKPTPGMQVRAHYREQSDPSDDREQLLYGWYFDSTLPNNIALEQLDANYSSTGFNAILSYKAAVQPYPPVDEEDTDGILDRVNDPTPIGYRTESNFGQEYDEDDMRGIRARNPSVTDTGFSAIVFDVPTEEFQDLVLAFAARRTTNGQETMVIEYSVTGGEPDWKSEGLSSSFIETGFEYQLYTVDFSDVEGHAHNADFRVRIRFEGENTTVSDGNTRFNNIAFFGNAYTGPRIEDIEQSRLEPNYPNPFGDRTTIPYQILSQSNVRLDVYTADGKHVTTLENREMEPGFYSAEFRGAGLASGVYILRLQAADHTDYRKMMMVRSQ